MAPISAMKPAAIAGLIAISFLCASAAATEVLTGRVIKVTDGDTVTILTVDKRQRKIRLAGIDARERKQPFGSRSRQNLSKLAYGKEAQADCPKRDRYGRQVCKVYVGGQDVGLRQIYDGLAWWYRAYAHEQSPEDLRRYELEERVARVVDHDVVRRFPVLLPFSPYRSR
jgi:endonuclease YncB( thermonuclease family)